MEWLTKDEFPSLFVASLLGDLRLISYLHACIATILFFVFELLNLKISKAILNNVQFQLVKYLF